MNKRVKIQSAGRTSDGAGGATVAWTDVATVWAAVEPLTGKEPYIAQQLQGQVTHKVTVRYRTGITPAQRVLYGTRVFDVEAVVDPKERHSVLILACEEVA